ncbi:MAG: sodium:proton exchanger [Actinomycetota bacterium]|nr:sodium:proton exchanger [Actinomycetota bacterium]
MGLDLRALKPSERLTTAAAVALTVASGAAATLSPHTVATFLISAVALAALAALVGQSIEQVGERLGPGATGLLQSALGNLPELLVGIFALRAGLIGVVRAAVVGSILANTLLVLGVAVLAGGLRHGTQRFASEAPKMIGTLLLLAVAALLVPTLAARLHTPAAPHATQLSGAVALILIAVYALSIPFWLHGGTGSEPSEADDPGPSEEPTGPSGDNPVGENPSGDNPVGDNPSGDNPSGDNPVGENQTGESRSGHPSWPLSLAIVLLGVGSLGAAVVSDWFVAALEPATKTLGLSQTFTGLVIVAIASNAVENMVGIRFALSGRPDYALSTILNSPLQVALLLTPALVLISHLTGPTPLTLVFPTLEVAALALATIVVIVVLADGEYVWLEGVALIGLYGIVVAAFWWG